MNKVCKTVIYVFIALLTVAVIAAAVMSFIPKFAENGDSLFNVTDLIYLLLPIIGILVTVLVIDYRNKSEGTKKDCGCKY